MQLTVPQGPARPSSVLTAALLAAGVAATLLAFQDRQPLTSSDFTLFYRSAAAPPADMYTPPPGPKRNNMNPPHFQALMRPLTAFDAPTASAIFRGIAIVAAIASFVWIGRTSRERWTLADAGALLAWAPLALNISLNQVTWILLPLLVHAWHSWKRDEWTAGAISYGVALSFKPFLGVFLLWMLITKRIRPLIVSCLVAAASMLAGVLIYGVDVFRLWMRAVGDVVWWRSLMNGSFQGFVARTLSDRASEPLVRPAWLFLLASAGGAAFVAITVWRTRARTIEDSWAPLMASALLASPLGWLYYGCWLLPGRRPFRLLFHAPLLWIPVFYTPPAGSMFVRATYDSRYFWGFLLLWVWTLFGKDAAPAASGAS